MRKLLLVLFFTAMGMFKGHSQALVQTYVDRCTGQVSVFSVPMNGSTVVAFYNRSRVFTAQDFSDGTLQAWLEETYLWWISLSPCSSTTTGAQATQQTTQQTTQQATQAATNAASTAAANTTTNVPSTPVSPPPATQTSQPTTTAPDTSSTNTAPQNTSTSGGNTTSQGNNTSTSGGSSSSQGSSQSNSNSNNSSSGSENTSSDQNTESTSSDSQNSESGTTGDEGGTEESTEVETTTEESSTEETTTEESTEETSTEESTEESSTEESSEESTEESTEEESTDEQSEEESTEEESNEESESEESEEESDESSEEESEEEDTEEESESDEDEDSEEEETEEESSNEDEEEDDKKKKKKRNLAPPIVTANAMAQQLPTGEYQQAVTLGLSQSSLMGTETYGVNLMVYDNLQQFMLNANYSKVHINKEGRVSRVYSASLGAMKMFTTYMGMMNHSWTFLGKKGSVAGIAFGTSATMLDINSINGQLYLDSTLLGFSLTSFYTKPIQYSPKLTVSPMLAVSSPFVQYEMFKKESIWNKDVMVIAGASFTYKLTQRFGLNLGANIIESTAPNFPTMKTFTIGGRLSF